MKLYYSAGSCSSSCHISLEEAGLKYEAIEVDFDNASDPNIALTQKLNTLGTLPIFINNEGKQLDQNMSIHLYVAGKVPEKNLFPKAGTAEYLEAINWFSFVAADLHKSVGGLFGVAAYESDKNVQAAVRQNLLVRAGETLKYLDTRLNGRPYIMGDHFTVIDSYAFIVASWTKYLDVSLVPYPNISAYLGRVAARPAVAKVLQAEGLLDA
jgi:glutathione S-transferase